VDVEIEGVKLTRRRLLMALSIGAGGFAAVLAGVPLIGFFFSPMLKKYPPVWRDVGSLDQFKVGDTVKVNLVTSDALPWDGPAQLVAAWLRRNDQENFTVYSSKCTHLGCPVRWVEVQWKPEFVKYVQLESPCQPGCSGIGHARQSAQEEEG
jgi:Rieske Fe-S protein